MGRNKNPTARPRESALHAEGLIRGVPDPRTPRPNSLDPENRPFTLKYWFVGSPTPGHPDEGKRSVEKNYIENGPAENNYIEHGPPREDIYRKQTTHDNNFSLSLSLCYLSVLSSLSLSSLSSLSLSLHRNVIRRQVMIYINDMRTYRCLSNKYQSKPHEFNRI